METTHLGALEVPDQGLGCMGMSEFYGVTDWDESVAVIRRAIELGVTFLDTADIYGSGHNEVLVGRAVHGRRSEVTLATKFGFDRSGGDADRRIRGGAAYVRHACEASLLRLGVDHIDLYYAHRPPQDVEIEETVGTLAELVAEGKVGHIGLSEVSESLLRRAHAVHPVAAVQSEYSLWTRDPEDTVASAMRELGIGLVPYSPLGRGFLTGTVSHDALGERDARGQVPKIAGDVNRHIADSVAAVGDRAGIPAAQVALAWVYAQRARLGISIVPIPGTKRLRWLEQNVAALEATLDQTDLRELDALADHVVGARY